VVEGGCSNHPTIEGVWQTHPEVAEGKAWTTSGISEDSDLITASNLREQKRSSSLASSYPACHEGIAGPVGRIGPIGDVVDAILSLERATFVTGETLHVDGGQAAGH
jgi:NAD(P)-dependent dehydrogenase (short-subunit alcohol dehydrogenase family)